MAKSYPKQSTQKGSVFAVAFGDDALSLFALLTTLLALVFILHNQSSPQAGAILLEGAGAAAAPPAAAEEQPIASVEPPDNNVRALAEYLSKRYRVSRDAMVDVVGTAFSAGHTTRTDPLLILAVMAVESRFNPIAESVMGAKGLMQVIPRHHPEKFKAADGAADVLDPEINILAGARILREYLAGSEDLPSALRRYGGGVSDLDNQYATKVIGERDRLEQVLRSITRRGAAPSRP